MSQFIFGLEWFVYGFIAGFVAGPVYKILTKIIEEAKIAKNEWRKPQ